MPETWASSGRGPAPGPDRPAGARQPGAGCATRSGPAGWRPGLRLPSSRTLAADLGVARNTVADVYGQLMAEGWLTARQGSGTRVAGRRAAGPARGRAAPAPEAAARRATTSGPEHPTSAFPRAALARGGAPGADRRPGRASRLTADPRGRPELRAGAGRLPGPGPRRARRPRPDRGLLRLHPGPGADLRRAPARPGRHDPGHGGVRPAGTPRASRPARAARCTLPVPGRRAAAP